MPTATTTAAPPAATAETRQQIGVQLRDLQIRAESFNEANNSVEVCWSTGARRTMFSWERWDYIDEELSTDPAHVRLERLNAGAPVLDTHQRYELSNQIGVVEPGSARLENGLGLATVRLSAREDLAPIVADIRAGIIRNLSVGYQVHSYEVTENTGERPQYRAVDWEPFEISFVPVPADAGATVRSGEPAQGGHPCIVRRASSPAITEERQMPEANDQNGGTTTTATTATTEERGTTAAPPATTTTPPATVSGERVLEAANAAGLDATVRERMLVTHSSAPFTEERLMAAIGTHFASRDQGQRQHNHIQVGNDLGREGRRSGMADAIVHRMSARGELSELGRQFRGLSLVEMARECLAADGVAVRGLAPAQIAERALHATSDLPYIVQNAVNRRLRDAYNESEPTYRQWTRRAPNAPNFKSIDIVQLSAMPELLKVNEGGEIKAGTISDGKVSYLITTYARRIGVTRQLIVNDDLRALDRFATGFAGSGRRLENRTVYSQLTGSNTYNGGALFHSNNGNLAGSGAAPSQSTLSAGRKAMRKQKGLQGEELNVAPRFIIGPTDHEQVIYQYTSAQYVPAQQQHINEFREGGRTALTPIIDAVLDGSSTTAWFLAADPADIDTIEWCYLDGAEGVQLAERMGFEIDGVELKATLDFAAAAIDHRGLFKDPGA